MRPPAVSGGRPRPCAWQPEQDVRLNVGPRPSKTFTGLGKGAHAIAKGGCRARSPAPRLRCVCRHVAEGLGPVVVTVVAPPRLAVTGDATSMARTPSASAARPAAVAPAAKATKIAAVRDGARHRLFHRTGGAAREPPIAAGAIDEAAVIYSNSRTQMLTVLSAVSRQRLTPSWFLELFLRDK